MSDAIGRVLLLISDGLLAPVVVLLLGLWALSVLYLGGFVAEAIGRWRRCGRFRTFVRDLRRDGLPRIDIGDVPAAPGLVAHGMVEFRRSPRAIGKLLDDLQLRAEDLLGRLHVCMRLGPMLGLAGTLIPLGPALKALAEGDTHTLANQLIIAFSTTVVGLCVGGLCFAMHAARQRWYNRDLNDLEFVLKRLARRRRRLHRSGIESCERSGV